MKLILPRPGDWDWYVGWFLVWERIYPYDAWCRVRLRRRYDLDRGAYYE
jgi:hypothetical protein